MVSGCCPTRGDAVKSISFIRQRHAFIYFSTFCFVFTVQATRRSWRGTGQLASNIAMTTATPRRTVRRRRRWPGRGFTWCLWSASFSWSGKSWVKHWLNSEFICVLMTLCPSIHTSDLCPSCLSALLSLPLLLPHSLRGHFQTLHGLGQTLAPISRLLYSLCTSHIMFRIICTTTLSAPLSGVVVSSRWSLNSEWTSVLSSRKSCKTIYISIVNNVNLLMFYL